MGTDIYEKLIKGYTQKQWGRKCTDLPAFIIKRLPVRLTFDNNYFNALYQGIPMGGYTKMVEHLLEGIEVRLGIDYLEQKEELKALAEKTVYTGAIDAYFDYSLGALEYRSSGFRYICTYRFCTILRLHFCHRNLCSVILYYKVHGIKSRYIHIAVYLRIVRLCVDNICRSIPVASFMLSKTFAMTTGTFPAI